MSGKPSTTVATFRRKNISSEDDERMKNIQKRLAEFDKVREGVVDATQLQEQGRRKRFGFMRKVREERQEEMTKQEALAAAQKQLDAEVEERRRQEEEAREVGRRMERVKEIDRLISEGQARLQDLVCEKDVLQRRLNPLFDYTSETFVLI
jgi:multidrug efflux pump subunit AcrA (membrane-fusion protein)